MLYHELLALSQSLLAEEHDGRFEDEAHGVQFESLLDFAQEVGNVEPLDSAVVEQLGWAEIDRLFAGLLVLAEEVVEYGAVFFVDALHFVDVLGHFLHAFQCVCTDEEKNDMITFSPLHSSSVYIYFVVCLPTRC